MELDRMALPVLARATTTPAPWLWAMKLAAAAIAPPMALLAAPVVMDTPGPPFPRSAVPVALVPMEFPCTAFPVALPRLISTPQPLLPEMMLPAPAAVPPTVLLAAPVMATPLPWLPSAAVADAVV